MSEFICRICHSNECLPYAVKDDSHSINKSYHYVQCSRCRVVGLHPLPTEAELKALYGTVHHKPHFHRNQQAYFAVVSWVRWGSENTQGTVPDIPKKAWDRIAKELGMKDKTSLLAVIL